MSPMQSWNRSTLAPRSLRFPSLDEGFGMPLLDAMARGVPVLTSNVSAMPEVAGDAALLVDPYRVASISEGLKQLTGDTSCGKS